MMKSRCRESTIIQSKHLDFAALHLDVAARHMKMQGKVFIHASMIHTFPCIFALLRITKKLSGGLIRRVFKLRYRLIEFYKLSDRINSLGYTRNFAGSIVLVVYTLGASLIDLGSSSNQCSLSSSLSASSVR